MRWYHILLYILYIYGIIWIYIYIYTTMYTCARRGPWQSWQSWPLSLPDSAEVFDLCGGLRFCPFAHQPHLARPGSLGAQRWHHRRHGVTSQAMTAALCPTVGRDTTVFTVQYPSSPQLCLWPRHIQDALALHFCLLLPVGLPSVKLIRFRMTSLQEVSESWNFWFSAAQERQAIFEGFIQLHSCSYSCCMFCWVFLDIACSWLRPNVPSIYTEPHTDNLVILFQIPKALQRGFVDLQGKCSWEFPSWNLMVPSLNFLKYFLGHASWHCYYADYACWILNTCQVCAYFILIPLFTDQTRLQQSKSRV